MLEQPAGAAIALTFGRLRDSSAKTAHGLLRGSERFDVLGIVDSAHAGETSVQALGPTVADVPVFGTVDTALAALGEQVRHAVVGVAFPGGRLPDACRDEVATLLRAGVNVVSGLHQPIGEDALLAHAAAEGNSMIFDIRRPRTWKELHFWSGEIFTVDVPIVAVLGTDCALGKRTTARLSMEACRRRGLRAEMIYTGQTGWLQGFRFGFILDSTLNDFVSGELEHAIVGCAREARPDVILIEGQSSLRNPTGPCGAELLLSGGARHVILQAAPGRRFYKGTEDIGCALPDIDDEIALIERYGAAVLAIVLNGEGLDREQLHAEQRRIAARTGLPVILPFEDSAPLGEILSDLAQRASASKLTHAD